MKHKTLFMACCLFCCGAFLAGAQEVVYEDDFNVDTSDLYTVIQLDRPDVGIDSDVKFAYDFSSDLDGDGFEIPPAPSSEDGGKVAAWISANFMSAEENALQSFAGIYSKEEFSGDYQLFVDYFCKVNKDGIGTTNQILVGINHSGEKLQNYRQNEFGFDAPLDDTDGYYWGAANDNGWGSADYAFLEGLPNAEDGPNNDECALWFIESPANDCFAPGDGEDDGVPRPYNDLFSVIYYDTSTAFVGCTANAWTTIRIDYIGGVASVYLKSTIMDDLDWAAGYYPWLQVTDDGFVKVCEYDDPDDTYPSGKCYLGFEDPYNSRFTETQFVLFDNLKVVQLSPAAASNWPVY